MLSPIASKRSRGCADALGEICGNVRIFCVGVPTNPVVASLATQLSLNGTSQRVRSCLMCASLLSKKFHRRNSSFGKSDRDRGQTPGRFRGLFKGGLHVSHVSRCGCGVVAHGVFGSCLKSLSEQSAAKFGAAGQEQQA